jgi:adenosine/AMP kinase
MTKRLTQKALNAIRENSPGIKSKLALALNCSEASINRYIRDNDDNLTKIAVLEIIEQDTGLSIVDILERNEIER